ncbi:hypothetical protein DNTS_030460 [Danionella cerebrum]|uniref:b(0,+)-type amino acid transporter 1 n=1 Tax=Danionella cerebrum TaxID=2873325 RepID=A0A553MLX7_9TELE|nr:hypothetical protein DNTS_030460 [Danionella translucida]
MGPKREGLVEKLKLKPELGLLDGIFLIAGVIIGSGIFMSPQYVLLYSGSPGASLLIWATSGLLAMMASLCYAELGTLIRESGGEYIYILRTSGHLAAFICTFTSNILLRPCSLIAGALIFAQNSLAPFYEGCPPPNGAVKFLAALGIITLTVVNCLNVRSSIRVTGFCTTMKILGLLIITTGGVVRLIQGDTSSSLQNAFEGKKLNIRSMVLLTKMKTKGSEKLTLKRELGLTSAVSLVAGIMIGSGIFMSPQFVLMYIGSSGIGTIIKESGGDYTYILQIYGPCLAFLLAFTTMFVMKPFGIIAGSLSFAKYAVAPFYPGCTAPVLVVKFVAATCILIVTMINILNVRHAMTVQVVFMVAKCVGLMIIIIGGLATVAQGSYGSLYDLKSAFADTRIGISSIGMAFYQCLWSYSGWYNLNNVTEELKRPEVNLPRALMIAIPLVTIIYILVNVSYLVVMTPAEMISSSAVAVTWGNKALGGWGWVMSVAAALSAFGSLNGSFFSGGRVCYVAAREGHMPDILAMAHMHRLTPSPALIFNTILALIVLIPGDFQTIINYFSFTAWFFYGITFSGLLYLKIKRPDLPRTITVPIIVPIVALLAAVFLVLAPIIENPQIEYLYVVLFILSGIVVYIPFIHFKMFPGLLDKLTVFLQLFLEVAPTSKNL